MSSKQNSISVLKEINESTDIEKEIKKINELYQNANTDYAKLMRTGSILIYLKQKYSDVHKAHEEKTDEKKSDEKKESKEKKTNDTIISKINNNFAKSEQAKKIFFFFRHQIILKYFIRYAIDYINLVQKLMQPDNMVKLVGFHNQLTNKILSEF